MQGEIATILGEEMSKPLKKEREAWFVPQKMKQFCATWDAPGSSGRMKFFFLSPTKPFGSL